MRPASLFDRRIVQISFLGFIVCAIYWRGVFNGFAYDDWYYLVGNEAYRTFDLKRIFTSMANGIEFLPIRDLTLLLDYQFWGEKNPGGFHFSNIVWFVFATVALYYLVNELVANVSCDTTESRGISYLPFLTAALFAVHPVNGEAVNFIGGRNVVLAAFFFFLSTTLYCRFLRTEKLSLVIYGASLLFFLFAMLCKATVIMLPFLLLALQLLAYGRRTGLRRLIWLDPFFVLSALFFYLFTRVGVSAKLIEKSPMLHDISASWLVAKLAKAVQIPFFYLAKLFAPIGLTIRYEPQFASSLSSPLVLAAVAGVLTLAALPFILARTAPLLSCAIIWFLVTLLPVLNLYDTYPVVADRYLFIPGVGIFLGIALLLVKLFDSGRKPAAIALVVAIIFCSGGYSYARVGVWKDNKSLWQATIAANPSAVEGYTALGAECLKDGDYDRAITLFKEASRINPQSLGYELGMGSIYFIQGDSRNAIAMLVRGLTINPNSARAHNLLGDVYSRIGETDKALEHFSAVLMTGQEGHHLVPGVRAKMALLKASQPESLAALKQKAASDPNDLKTLGNLALQLDKRGEYREAMSYYRRMESLGMKDWRLFNNMANILMKWNMFSQASSYLERSLELNPKNPDALNNLGLVRMNMRDFRGAISAFEKAIAIDGSYSYAQLNLARTYLKMGDRQTAERYFNYITTKFPQLRDRVREAMQS
ncbi:tetratricopeptide repeat protein [Geobacter pelophilus]|uniref:Tetratricopeptide repeat protein n=1 Tax=Geoanaerobacter pelophilus TaxID=60036 RepID=A0AAW4L1M9_9BACT|nr:tetratricopeptide repeat protein [Geoanaerobacter pelophilus]MBT0663432.1 tetratricopeptide repeat protein [Geoanaerobacter pelophilus]